MDNGSGPALVKEESCCWTGFCQEVESITDASLHDSGGECTGSLPIHS
jgi:hypothetical protein